jgi:membrane associated rhomboid family serine protease
MIPIRDVIPTRGTPWVTVTLIAATLLASAASGWLDAEARTTLYFRFGLVPADPAWLPLVTSLFLHSGWLHLIPNLLALWIFGENVEDRMGHARFAVFYLLCGAAGNAAGCWAAPDIAAPMVGPGAAVAGVTGAYFTLFPRSRILVVLPLVVVVDIVEMPAPILAAFWVVIQIAGDVGRLVVSPGDQAFVLVTHLAGCLTGVVSIWVFRRPERLTVDWWSHMPARPSTPAAERRNPTFEA